MQALPFLARARTRTPVMPFVLGAIGAMIAGGIAAAIVFSPRTRHRALDLAKEGVGKVRNQVGQIRRGRGAGAEDEREQRSTSPSGYQDVVVAETSYQNTGV